MYMTNLIRKIEFRYVDDDNDNDDDAKVCTALPGTKERQPKTTTNAHSHVFAAVTAIGGTSWAHAGSSRIVGTLSMIG